MSTQHWLYPEQVIENASRSYEPTFIVIERPRHEQLVSYVSHLRRGHIENKPISSVYKNDAGFADYLDRMSRWNEDYKVIKKKYSDLKFIDVLFENLISDPVTTIKKIIPEATVRGNFDRSTNKNPQSYPRFESQNKLFFSNTMRNIGRSLPQCTYSGLIRLRKSSVKMNLKEGKSKFFDDDKDFIIKAYN